MYLVGRNDPLRQTMQEKLDILYISYIMIITEPATPLPKGMRTKAGHIFKYR